MSVAFLLFVFPVRGHAADIQMFPRANVCQFSHLGDLTTLKCFGGLVVVDRNGGVTTCAINVSARYKESSVVPLTIYRMQDISEVPGYCYTQDGLKGKLAGKDLFAAPGRSQGASAGLMFFLFNEDKRIVTVCVNVGGDIAASRGGLAETACSDLRTIGKF